MSPASATLVVPTRGGSSRLPVLFRALEEQSTQNFEVVVVLDEDIDDSLTVCRLYESRVPLEVIQFPQNRGRSAALNAGHAAARGDVLIRCDDDLEPRTDYVANHLKAHEEGECGVVGLYQNVYPSNRYAEVYGEPQDVRFRRDAYATPPEMRWRYWAGNVSVSRATWELVGPYDTAFRAYGWEDVDWGYRLHQQGLPVKMLPSLETPHHVAATNAEVRAMRAFASGAAKARFLEKHGPGVLPARDASGGWARLVSSTSATLNEGRTRALARFVDRWSPRLPDALATKATAFTVETAALAGERLRPSGDVTAA